MPDKIIPFPYPDKKYKIIYADPPWKYHNKENRNDHRQVESHYTTMDVGDICNLPVADIADENCILFIWGTWTHIVEVQQVITAWGFNYKTVGFVWVKKVPANAKNHMGMGMWTRANTEYCLLATKGSPKRLNAGISQMIEADAKFHSKKPDQARKKIIKLMGDLPRIELFARTKIHGWDVWGNDEKLKNTPLEHFESIDSFEVDSEVIK